jgi:hypothetical protein
MEFKSFSEFNAKMRLEEKRQVQYHNLAAVKHGYRSGTKVGTSGYLTKNGFVHVYHHPKQGHEIHVLTNTKGETKWMHIGKDSKVHSVGRDSSELHRHLAEFHPEVAEKAKQERERKKTAEEKKKRDDLLARKQGQVMDKIIASGKLPAIQLNGTPKQPSVSSGKKKSK